MSNNSANLILGADTVGLQQGLSDAAKAANVAGQQIKASTEQMASSTEKTEVATMGLVQAHRRAAKEAQILAQNTGVYSEETRKATIYAAKLGHELEVMRMAEATYRPGGGAELMGKSLSTFTRAAGGAAAGMALLGVENDKVLKTMMKLQSIMMLSEGIKAVGELKKAYIEMGIVMQAQVLPAIKGMTAALLANPILAIAAAIAVVGTAAVLWYDHIQNKREEEFLAEQSQGKKEIESMKKAAADKERVAKLSIGNIKDANEKLQVELENNRAKDLADIKKYYAERLKIEPEKAREILETQHQEEIALKEKYKQEQEKLDITIKNDPIQKFVDELERKKLYLDALGKYSGSVELQILNEKMLLYKADTKEFKDLLNQKKILLKKNANDLALAQAEADAGAAKDALDMFNAVHGIKQSSLNFINPLTGGNINIPDIVYKPKFGAPAAAIEKIRADTSKEAAKLEKSLAEAGGKAGMAFASNLGAAMAGQKVDWGKELLQTLGDFATQMGAALMAVGVALNVAAPGTGVNKMIAGGLLMAAGSMIGGFVGAMGSSSGGSSSGGGGSYSGSSQNTGWNGAGSGGFGNNIGNMQLVTQLNGRNTNIMLNRNNYVTGRVR